MLIENGPSNRCERLATVITPIPLDVIVCTAIFLEADAVATRTGFRNKRVNEFIFTGSVQSWMSLLIM